MQEGRREGGREGGKEGRKEGRGGEGRGGEGRGGGGGWGGVGRGGRKQRILHLLVLPSAIPSATNVGQCAWAGWLRRGWEMDVDEYGVEVAVEVDVGERVLALNLLNRHTNLVIIFWVCNRYKTSKMTNGKSRRGAGGAWKSLT